MQEYWGGLPSPSPVDHILSDLSTTTRPSWVAPRACLSFIELDKAVVRVIRLASFLWLWFQCLSSNALSQHLLSHLGFSYLGPGLSLHACSSKAQPLLLTLDKFTPPDLERGVAPLGPPAPMQLPLLGRGVAPLQRPGDVWLHARLNAEARYDNLTLLSSQLLKRFAEIKTKVTPD